MPTEMTPGQRAYEQKRAAKAGMSLDKWLHSKEEQQAEAARPAAKSKPPGLLTRLIDRAHQPLKKGK